MLRLNGGFDTLNVQTLREVKVLRLGTAADLQNYRVDENTAMLFDLSVHYLEVLQEELARAYSAIDAAEIKLGAQLPDTQLEETPSNKGSSE